ncbi:MAG: ferrochelatase [Candidatus Calescibacterium sp.]|nr:ferrochelatase [Candidatus Calescibacterium sp.]MCX7972244.1 ferrochelatase [bacterium]MDW8195155.1 ferrochelatase [Candidatus Calescibacterium sp.]
MIGVLLMSYGSIYSLDDVERFYTHILKGKKPRPTLLEELKQRFIAIGGYSPLNQISRKQAEKLQKALGEKYKVYLAFKHIDPYIEDVVLQMEKDDISKAIGIILSPYYSNYNISDYFKRAKSEKIHFSYVYGYYDNPMLIECFKRRIVELLDRLNNIGDLFFIFSAHSLPEKILPDPYPEQLRYVVNKLVQELSIENYAFAYQSAGRTSEKWLGPDILEVIQNTASKYKTIISCPIGFISDHLEVLYDIDIEAKNLAKTLGSELYRIRLLNDDEDFIETLKRLVFDNAA